MCSSRYQFVALMCIAAMVVFFLGIYTDVIYTTSASVFHAFANWSLEADGRVPYRSDATADSLLWNHKVRIEAKDIQSNPQDQKTLPAQRNNTKANEAALKTTPIPKSQQNRPVKKDDNSEGHLKVTESRVNDSQDSVKVPENRHGRMEVNTTTVTFDPKVVVHCKESPYVLCDAPPPKSKGQNHTMRIVNLRRSRWLSTPDFSRCRYNNCILDGETVDSINEYTDAVAIYGVGLRDSFKPPRRWPHQLYAVMAWESPYHTRADFLRTKSSIWNELFNITISYRVDSDVFIPYGKIKFQPQPIYQRPNYYEIATNKTRTVAWFVSNCRAPSQREKYVEEMKKYIDVDIFGACGKPCPRPTTSDPCREMLSTTYKFYLSFENSICTDYISEKLLKIYKKDTHIIPVVRGGINYDKYFPNMTFINAGHFKTAKDLALHLKSLATDLEAYSRYLEYRDMYVETKNSLGDVYCGLCEFLHTRKSSPKIYDMKAWMGDGHCHEPTDIS